VGSGAASLVEIRGRMEKASKMGLWGGDSVLVI